MTHLPCPKLPCEAPTVVDSASGLIGFFIALTDWLFIGFLLTAVVFILIAAFQFLIGGGDAKQIEEARLKLFWAGMSVVIALLAKTIPAVITSIVTGT